MIRILLRPLLFALALAIGSISVGQSSVDGLMNASDAGQRVFDQRSAGAPSTQTGRIHKLKDVDERPSYPDGDAALLDHLLVPASCGALPDMEHCFGSSRMSFDFVVNTDGSVSDVEFSKEGCPILQPFVLCAVRGLSPWKPGLLNGVPVRVRMHTSVKYDLR